MTAFDFYMPTQVFGGENCLARHFEAVAALGKRCLVVTGKNGAKQSGALEDIQALCAAHGIQTAVFDGICANPLLSDCVAAAKAAQDRRVQFVVGIGGGSVMDAAKVIAWLAANDAADTEALYARTLPHLPLPCVLIGTTAGTGSEVTAVSVLTEDASGRKKSVTDARCYAKYVFADARYTHSMSLETTVSTALDALCHAAEGYLSPTCGQASAAFAEQAFALLGEGFAALLQGENKREAMLYGSLWAGLVINQTGTAFPHPMGYILTEEYGVPHGLATAVFLPALLERARQYCPERLQRLQETFGGAALLEQVTQRYIHLDVAMTVQQVEQNRARLTGCKHYQKTPGGFSAQQALALLQRLFVREEI